MDNDTMRTIFTGYASVISTLALVLSVINLVQQNKSKIKVYATVVAAFSTYVGTGIVSEPVLKLSIDITNYSKSKKYVNRPALVLPHKIDGYDRLNVVPANESVKYPVCLEQGQKYNVDVNLNQNLLSYLEKIKNTNRRIKVAVKDTMGKEYFSNSLKAKNLITHCEMNIEKSI